MGGAGAPPEGLRSSPQSSPRGRRASKERYPGLGIVCWRESNWSTEGLAIERSPNPDPGSSPYSEEKYLVSKSNRGVSRILTLSRGASARCLEAAAYGFRDRLCLATLEDLRGRECLDPRIGCVSQSRLETRDSVWSFGPLPTRRQNQFGNLSISSHITERNLRK